MPCRSDYMEPTHRERLLRETAQLYSYVLTETGQRVPEAVTDAARNLYCGTDYVSHLCEQLTNMDSNTRHRVVYNAHDKTSRQLADWWERHLAADQQRLAQEQAQRQQGVNLARAMSKLDASEVEALRRHFTS